MAKKWIGKATENAHGQFAAKAKAAGKSTAEFAREKEDAPGTLGKEARLAETLMKLPRGDKKKAKHSPTDARKAMYGDKGSK